MNFFGINKILGIEVDQFLKDFVFFTENYFPYMIDYYQGKSKRNPIIFTELNRLKVVSIEILTGFNNSKTSFVSLMDWEVLEAVEEANTKLNSMSKISKYLRSSIILATYNDGIQNADYMLEQNQSLENTSLSELKSDDPNNDWVHIATDNDLNEEDYTPKGLINLKLTYYNPGTVNDVKTVVDNITGENILGKDVYQLLTFVDQGDANAGQESTQDLTILEYRETVAQDANILLNLSKGDNPEFWQDGISSNLLGNAATSFAYPILFRELSYAFSKDDTISSFELKDIKVDKDAIFMELSIETILGDIIKGELSL